MACPVRRSHGCSAQGRECRAGTSGLLACSGTVDGASSTHSSHQSGQPPCRRPPRAKLRMTDGHQELLRQNIDLAVDNGVLPMGIRELEGVTMYAALGVTVILVLF